MYECVTGDWINEVLFNIFIVVFTLYFIFLQVKIVYYNIV